MATAAPLFINSSVSAYSVNNLYINNLSSWDLSQTRANGHQQLQTNGLHVWTDNTSSLAKAAAYYDVADFPLAQGSDFNLAWTGTSPAPGGQLVVDLNNNGVDDGILVVEPDFYGSNLWLANINSADLTDLDSNANVPHVGGGGGSYNGTITQWLQAYPNAKVTAIGYSLGSGIKGDGVISDIVANGVTYTFALPSWNGLSFTTDRTYPSGGVAVTSNELTLGVDASAASTQGSFYQYEGIQANISDTSSMQASLYLDPAWSTKDVNVAMWGVAHEVGTSDMAWPIIGYVGGPNASYTGFRVFDTSDTGTYINLPNVPAALGQTYTLGIVFNSSTSQYDYYVNDNKVISLSAQWTDDQNVVHTDSVLKAVIFNDYNTGTPSNDYTAQWSNFQTDVTYTNPLPAGDNIDLTSTITDNGDGTATATLPASTTVVSSNDGIQAVLPAGTMVTGNSNWNGTINPPTATTVTVPAANGTVVSNVTAVKVGSDVSALTFDQPVQLNFPGQAGKTVAFQEPGQNYFTIIPACDGNIFSGSFPAGHNDCYVTSVSDLVVWTKHFSTFVTYTVATAPATSSPSSSSNEPSTAKTTSAETTPADESGDVLGTNSDIGTGAQTDTPSVASTAGSAKKASKNFLGLGWWWLLLVPIVIIGGYVAYVYRTVFRSGED